MARHIEYRRARLQDNRLIASNADELGESVDQVGKNHSPPHLVQMVLGESR